MPTFQARQLHGYLQNIILTQQALKNSLKDEHNRQMKTHWEEEKQIKQAKRNSTDDLICQTLLHYNLRTEEEKHLANHLVFSQTTKQLWMENKLNSAQPGLAQLKYTLAQVQPNLFTSTSQQKSCFKTKVCPAPPPLAGIPDD